MGRLSDAALVGLEPLTARGFRIATVADSPRGEAIEAVGNLVAVRVDADWLEGELAVSLQAGGQPRVSLDRVVDLARVDGLHLRRIPRSASRGMIESTLSKISSALVDQASDVLAETQSGLDRLRA
jgi:hypothetical protein